MRKVFPNAPAVAAAMTGGAASVPHLSDGQRSPERWPVQAPAREPCPEVVSDSGQAKVMLIELNREFNMIEKVLQARWPESCARA